MERIDLGEECDYKMVCNILEESIKVWNEAICHLRQLMEDPQKMLEELQRQELEPDADRSDDLEDPEAVLERLAERMREHLKTVDLKPTQQNFLLLGTAQDVFFFGRILRDINKDLYIYI